MSLVLTIQPVSKYGYVDWTTCKQATTPSSVLILRYLRPSPAGSDRLYSQNGLSTGTMAESGMTRKGTAASEFFRFEFKSFPDSNSQTNCIDPSNPAARFLPIQLSKQTAAKRNSNGLSSIPIPENPQDIFYSFLFMF